MRRVLLLSVLLGACANELPSLREDVVTTNPVQTPIAPYAECEVTTYREPALAMGHLEPCSPLMLQSEPPTGGDHFGMWAAWGTYTTPIPWGFLVHSMEHGAVVLAYRCESDCADVVAEFESIAVSIDDPLCRGEAVPQRIIIVPMPELEVAVAALAWEHGYLATCLDPPSLRAFVNERYGMGRENLCNSGVDFSASGWCG